MSYTNSQLKDFIKSLQIIHLVLILGVVIFGGYIAFTLQNELFFSYEDDKAFLFLAIVIAFVGNLSSKFLFAKMLKQIPEKSNLSQKAVKYSTAHIFRMAMLEFPALMCIIFTFQSSNSFYFILTGILVLMMIAIFPTKNKFENDVPLTSKEKTILEKL
ncbi:hypothetical protein SAMN05444411_102161 [Lutibacter oricola]|uniref:Uncharacterized protein n=1 Tax=Lutibacter oricola TaxID=762486 RepID=A0A1H2WBX0_9FLAO|nr:hypothetical protein [Lutibacter oricola]SDW78163.1 hypothetical protein SAMN05444411_102161 [Lutibacter oricola]